MAGGPVKKARRRGRKSSEKESDPKGTLGDYKSHSSPLIQLSEEVPTWHEFGAQVRDRNATVDTDPPLSPKQKLSTSSLETKYRNIADMIYQQELVVSNNPNKKTKDDRWVENTIRKGTLKDKIAAMAVVVSTEPVHKFYNIDGLCQMAGCTESGGQTNSRVAQLAAEALEDLFLNTFLPPDRKLLTLADRPLYLYEKELHNGLPNKKYRPLSPKVLLLWRFEEMLKEKYQLFLTRYLAYTLREGVEMQKVNAMRIAYSLLSSVPEGEAQLLSMIVNKLGDPGKKTAAAAGHELRRVLVQHPNMQTIIAREVQQLAHRPHLSSKALYNCIIFLNQLKLKRSYDNDSKAGPGPPSLVVSLIKTYFRLFDVVIKETNKSPKDEDDNDGDSNEEGSNSRILSALLTGVNRAHPYLPSKDKDLEDHIDALYKVVHKSSLGTATQALMLLFQVIVGPQEDENYEDDGASKLGLWQKQRDRFYRALFSTISQQHMLSAGKHLTMYFNLLYKAIKNDDDSKRSSAFIKALLCTTIHCGPPIISATLFLINELSKANPDLERCLTSGVKASDSHQLSDYTKREPRAALANIMVNETTDKNHADQFGLTNSLPLWDLSLLKFHYHPSAAKFANSIGEIEYSGDPLKDFTLAPFLDKFAYRNPKSTAKLAQRFERKQSIAERKSGKEGIIQAHLSLPLNDPNFINSKDVPDQDKFFHRFFVERARRDEIKGIVRGGQELMDEEDEEGAMDEAIDAAEEAEGFDARKKFEEYEQAWETDEEEEAFVDALAESMLDDHADMDDEDPDMNGWADMYSDNEDSPGKAGQNDTTRKNENKSDSEGDDDESGLDEALLSEEEHEIVDDDDDNFMDSDSSNDNFDESHLELDADQDSDDMIMFADDVASQSEEEDENARGDNSKGDTFASLSDYQEMIDKSWKEPKRLLEESVDEPDAKGKTTLSKKRQKKRKT